MDADAKNALGTLLLGLLLGGVGLVFAANLFGVAGRQARDSHASGQRLRRFALGRAAGPEPDPERAQRFSFRGVRTVGAIWALIGLMIAVRGGFLLIAALS